MKQILWHIERLFFVFLDAVLPHSPETVIARSLSEEILRKMVSPVTLVRDPWITSFFSYLNPKVRALIWAVKYRGEQGPLPALGRVAAREIARILDDKEKFEGWQSVMVAPIPSSPSRIHSRGYNQADRIVLAILPNLEGRVEYAPDILSRKNRESQVKVPHERRHHNIEGAFFTLRPDKIRGRYILLVDDVVETGTTFKDARRVLLAAGARDVAAVAMAH